MMIMMIMMIMTIMMIMMIMKQTVLPIFKETGGEIKKRKRLFVFLSYLYYYSSSFFLSKGGVTEWWLMNRLAWALKLEVFPFASLGSVSFLACCGISHDLFSFEVVCMSDLGSFTYEKF